MGQLDRPSGKAKQGRMPGIGGLCQPPREKGCYPGYLPGGRLGPLGALHADYLWSLRNAVKLGERQNNDRMSDPTSNRQAGVTVTPRRGSAVGPDCPSTLRFN